MKIIPTSKEHILHNQVMFTEKCFFNLATIDYIDSCHKEHFILDHFLHFGSLVCSSKYEKLHKLISTCTEYFCLPLFLFAFGNLKVVLMKFLTLLFIEKAVSKDIVIKLKCFI